MASDGFQTIGGFDVKTNSNTCCWTTRRENAKETNTWSFSFTLAMLQVWKNKRRRGKEPKVATGIKQIVGGGGGAERLMR